MAFDLKTRVWQTGALDWWGIIDGNDVYLGSREFPLPPEEGDEWKVISTGDRFRIVGGEIVYLGTDRVEIPVWLRDPAEL